MIRIAASLILAAVLAASAVTQPLAQDRPLQSERREQPVRIQVAMNFFVAGSTNETTAEPEVVRERARRIVYEMASKECVVLQSVLAKDCRLENVTVNVNRQMGQQVEGYMVSGNMAYSVTLK
jgi:hypothetical protein